MMHRNKSVDVHQFAMVPRAEIPRASFNMQKTHKTTFDAGYLIPVFLEEILPGDTFNVRMTAFARLATPIFPIMDNLHLDSFFSLCRRGLFGITGSALWVSRITPAILFRIRFRSWLLAVVVLRLVRFTTISGLVPPVRWALMR